MRDTITGADGFLGGVVVGLAAAGVTALVVGAVRRARYSRTEHEQHFIDGVRPPNDVELAAAPTREGNAYPRRLESESFDPPNASQRW
jgi:hypothetical protein